MAKSFVSRSWPGGRCYGKLCVVICFGVAERANPAKTKMSSSRDVKTLEEEPWHPKKYFHCSNTSTYAPWLVVITCRIYALRLRIVKKLLLLPRNFRSDQPTPVVQPSQIQKTFINLSVS